MKEKVLKLLQAKCKSFGLTEKAIDELAELASKGLKDDASEEDIEKQADSFVPIAKAMQGEITRKTRKPNQSTKKNKSSKSEDEEDVDDEDTDTQDEDIDARLPKWFNKWKKQNDAAIKKLQDENTALKAEKAKSERKGHIAELAKKAGVSEKMMEAQLALHEAYEEGDDETVNKALAAIKQIAVSEKLPSEDTASILSSSEQAMKDDATSWANSLPDAK